MLVSLLLLHSVGAPAAPSIARSVAVDPPVRVWFSSDGDYQLGDKAKVYAQTAEDGHLVVLRADASGQVRVLFPIDPAGDQPVRGGKKYELKGDRKSTRLNSSHGYISYAVFCLKKKKKSKQRV